MSQEAPINPAKQSGFSNKDKREMRIPKAPPTQSYPKKPLFWNLKDSPKANRMFMLISGAVCVASAAFGVAMFMIFPKNQQSEEYRKWETDLKVSKNMYYRDTFQRHAQYTLDRAKRENKSVRDLLTEHFVAMDVTDKDRLNRQT
jgi:hypothetical protein